MSHAGVNNVTFCVRWKSVNESYHFGVQATEIYCVLTVNISH